MSQCPLSQSAASTGAQTRRDFVCVHHLTRTSECWLLPSLTKCNKQLTWNTSSPISETFHGMVHASNHSQHTVYSISSKSDLPYNSSLYDKISSHLSRRSCQVNLLWTLTTIINKGCFVPWAYVSFVKHIFASLIALIWKFLSKQNRKMLENANMPLIVHSFGYRWCNTQRKNIRMCQLPTIL